MAPTPRTQSTSAGELFQLIRRGEVSTRGQLMAVTGLARSTITQRLDALIGGGYVEEVGSDASTGGRPPTTLAPSERHKTILAVDLGATHGRLAVLDGSGTPLTERAIETHIQDGPVAVLERACKTLLELLDEARRSGTGQRPDVAAGPAADHARLARLPDRRGGPGPHRRRPAAPQRVARDR